MAASETKRHPVCDSAELEVGDVTDVKIEGKTYAVYRLADGLHATDGLCTHEQACLADGLVLDGDLIECPKHNARFHIPTGKAVRRPAKADLAVYAVVEEGGKVFIEIAGER
jgi:3-phenylpropionate/trans-cinnamate dioxygenase ferredoxin component